MCSAEMFITFEKLIISNTTFPLKTTSPGFKSKTQFQLLTDPQWCRIVQNEHHSTKPIKIEFTYVYGTKKNGSLRVVQDYRDLNAASHDTHTQ
jgi:hypothetical protein